MHQEYNSQLLRDLRDQRVQGSSQRQKLADAHRAEDLLRQLDANENYSFDYITYRVTEVRDFQAPLETMLGRRWRSDLHNYVEDMTDAANVTAESVGQPVHTVDELSKMYNVSSKTISRWRRQGLVSRKFIFDGKRKRVGFLRSSVETFVKQNHEKVKRGERFSQLSERDREEILECARRLAAAGDSPSEVARKIANSLSRSVETIRYTIKDYDLRYTETAIFPDKTGPLNPEMKQRIVSEHRTGKSVNVLAKRYRRTQATIYRVLNEMRANEIMQLPLDFMDSLEFYEESAEKEILTEMPEPETRQRRVKAPAGVPHYLASLYDVPILTREQENHLFRKYNYLKFRARTLRDQMDPVMPSAKLMDEIEDWYDQAVAIKNLIVQSNLRLVVSIAKRHLKSQEDFFQLISDGNMSLIRAGEKFDYTRGNKFSTYATWSIMKNFARTIPEEFKYRDRFRTTGEEVFLSTADARTDRYQLESDQKIRERQVGLILHHLDDREQQIIIRRFGLNHEHEPLTLQEVGSIMGVTKERVRQIEARALSKLKAAAEQERIDLPEAS